MATKRRPAPKQFNGLRVGIQSFTFRQFDLETAVAAVAALGLNEMELVRRHLKPQHDKKYQNKARRILRKHNMTMRVHGLDFLTTDPAECRLVFDFARQWNVETITSCPEPEALDAIEALAEEYQVKVAIHNYGPGSLYPDAATLRSLLKGRSSLLGLCVDTGHFLRVPGEDPTAIIEEFSDRVHGVHLRDMDLEYNEYVLGAGGLDLRKVLHKLQEIEFKGLIAVEHELDPEDPSPALQESLHRIEEALK